ncbi:hypothetical protein Anas_10552 [Armadillidium nasatum]|uniref:Uncharacterized protein n=1 Tax=Armadillidium nasatum TaxID=96803 RepID=A0A5N5SLX2_9CRUS|nr:hypothetical protein Anas_10552 [Armadillidium nasatum]
MKDYEELVRVAERAKREEIQMKIPKLKGGRMRLEVYSDASFGNVSEGRTQIGYCIRMKDMAGNCCPLLWKSKVAKRVVRSTLSAETLSMVEAIEWGEYIKYLWEELTNKNTSDNIDIIAMTDCKSLRDSIKSTKGVKNRILRIELANLKEKMENKIIKSVEWVNSRLQLADEKDSNYTIKEDVDEMPNITQKESEYNSLPNRKQDAKHSSSDETQSFQLEDDDENHKSRKEPGPLRVTLGEELYNHYLCYVEKIRPLVILSL